MKDTMENKENLNPILNPNEGKIVDNIVWPFYRYKALLPKQIGTDLFVWLYLSLIIFKNQEKGQPSDIYSDEVQQEVEIIMREKFSAVIDSQTLDKIKSNSEEDFVENNKLKQETFSFVNTYESLFSDKLDVKDIYQDAITGEVVPYFGDTSHIDDSDYRDKALKTRAGIKEPSKSLVKKAYEHYMRLKRYNADTEAVELQAEFDELFKDEDEQTFINDSFDSFEQGTEIQEKKSLSDYNVIFLKDSRVLYDVDIPVLVRGNEIMLKSPFDKITDQWLNRCAIKAQNVSEDVSRLIQGLKQQYTVEKHTIADFKEAKKSDFASTLKHCAVIYRMIDSLGDDQLRLDVIDLDANCSANKITAHYHVGRILDMLVRDHIEYSERTPRNERDLMTFDRFCIEMDAKLYYTGIDYRRLQSEGVFKDWKNRRDFSYDGNKNVSFKADIADIVLKTDFIKSNAMYPSFFVDLFQLYDDRSKADHAARDARLDTALIPKLEKVLKVLFQLI